MAVTTLYEKIELLPLQKQQEVMDYIDFLLVSLNKKNIDRNSQTKKYPIAGCMKGTFGQMSDDFNEPLDDFKDYM
jgi:hypothetical protein